jgi:16S rRNA (adenine1518-N6/adenine1519-N6)-dimethyltransferase
VVRARRSLGQNFLVDVHYQQRIVDAVDTQPGDLIVEIGPGTGALTRHLAARAGRFIAVELDGALASTLEARFADQPHVRIVHADFLELEPAALAVEPERTRVVGNIPYYITTPIIFRLLDRAWRPASITLMVQREVADRVLASPGHREYGALSVGVRSVARAERLFHVPRGAFRPVPNVDSSVIRITPLLPPPLAEAEETDLRALTRTAFGWRRKQLQRILRSAEDYALVEDEVAVLETETGIAMNHRPEAISPEQFVRLSRALRARGKPTRHRPPPGAP